MTTASASRFNPVRWWTDFWFAPSPPTNLGICRAVFFGLLFYFYVGESFAPWADIPREFWKPQWPFEVFHIPILSRDAMFFAEVAWKTALAASCIGLFTRGSVLIAAALGFYLLGIRHCFGKLGAEDSVLIITMAILAVSRCGDAFSIDALISRKLRKRDPAAPLDWPRESGEYTWPIKAAWLAVSLVFLNSALAKLRYSGVQWALSDNFSNLLVHRFYGSTPETEFGLRLAHIGWLCKTLAAGALLVELCFPLVLFSKRARWILVPSAYLMQYGNAKLLGVDFTQFTFVYIFFINWTWLGGKLGGLFARREGAAASSQVDTSPALAANSPR